MLINLHVQCDLAASSINILSQIGEDSKLGNQLHLLLSATHDWYLHLENSTKVCATF